MRKADLNELTNQLNSRSLQQEKNYLLMYNKPQPFYHNRFTALFPGPPGWAGARREVLDFMVQGKINRSRHTDNPAGHHSIRTNQCPPPPFPHFLQARCPSCHSTNSVKALKATSAFGLGKTEKMLEFSTVLPALFPYHLLMYNKEEDPEFIEVFFY